MNEEPPESANPGTRADFSRRLVGERQRLGLTAAQFAVLVGVSEAQQLAYEAPDGPPFPFEYGHSATRLGVDFTFVMGFSAESKCPPPSTYDDPFVRAIQLLLRSQQAVEAFIGEGAAKSTPQLVAALMAATLLESLPTSGEINDYVDSIANAIEGAAEVLSQAIAPE